MVLRAVTARSHAAALEIPPPREPMPVQEPVAYAWPETPPTGLRKFNLGTIPASVTPPRTWRRAAWFAVGTAVFVVLALGLAAFTLVGKPRNGSTIDALPGPTQHLLITDLPGDRLPTTTTGANPTTSRTSSPPPTSTTRPTGARSETGRSDQPGAAGPTTELPGTGVNPAQPPPAPATMPPPRQTLAAAAPSTDAEAMGDRTEQYFALVVVNAAAAYQLTGGRLRAEGIEGIEARYVGVERVEIRRITIDPTSSVTRSTLVLVGGNGSTRTVERRLTFSNGANPKVIGDSPVS